MGWKKVIVLGAVLAVMVGAYVFYQPVEPTPIDARLIAVRGFDKIEVKNAKAHFTIVRKIIETKEAWEFGDALRRRIDDLKAREMVRALVQRVGMVIPPGAENYKPAVFGTNEPAVTVTATSGKNVTVLKFGNFDPIAPDIVYVQREGEESVIEIGANTRRIFEVEPDDIRSRSILHFSNNRVIGMNGHARYIHITQEGKREERVRKFEMKRHQPPGKVGWHLEKPHEERLVEQKVASLVTEISSMQAQEFIKLGDKKIFETPAKAWEIFLAGADKPIRVLFGDPDFKKKVVPVWIQGDPEYGIIPLEKDEKIPTHFDAFRDEHPFKFAPNQIRSIEVKTRDGGFMKIEPVTVKEGPVEKPTWSVSEPKDLKYEQSDLELFLGQLMSAEIGGFDGPQPDHAIYDLKPPRLSITFHLIFGEKKETQVYHFGLVGTGEDGFMARDGQQDVYRVRSHYVRHVSRVDLNIRNKTLFSVPIDDITGFEWEYKTPFPPNKASGYSFRVARDAEGKWAYTDTLHRKDKVEIDPERVRGILTYANYIEAKRYLGRGKDLLKEYKVDHIDSHGRLTIHYEEDGKPKQIMLLITDNLETDRKKTPIYYARFHDSDVLFEYNHQVIDDLLLDVNKRPKPMDDE